MVELGGEIMCMERNMCIFEDVVIEGSDLFRLFLDPDLNLLGVDG